VTEELWFDFRLKRDFSFLKSFKTAQGDTSSLS